MTLPKIPFFFRENETLVPSKLLQNFQRVSKDIKELKERQVVRFSVHLNFNGLTFASGTQESKVVFTNLIKYVELESLEVSYYQASGVTLTIDDDSGTLMQVESAGATTKAWGFKSQFNSTLNELNFSINSGTVDKLDVIVHCKSYRFGEDVPSLYDIDDVLNSGFTATNVSTELTEIADQVADDTANRGKPIFMLFHRRNFTSLTNINEYRIPATGKAFKNMVLRGVCAAGADTLTATLKNKAGTTVGSAITITATGTETSSTVVLSDTQSDTNGTEANDYKLVLSRTGATNWQNAYCIIEYEG